MLYKSITYIPKPVIRWGSLMKHASQLNSLIVSHLDVSVSRRGWGSGGRWCFDLFGDHGLQVDVYFLVFEDAKFRRPIR